MSLVFSRQSPTRDPGPAQADAITLGDEHRERFTRPTRRPVRRVFPGARPLRRADRAIPRAVAVRDLGQDTAALWLEHMPARRVIWDAGRHARAAYLLGRFAASRTVAPLATAVHGARTPRVYADGWLAHIVLPALTEDGVWAHAHPLRPLAHTDGVAVRDRPRRGRHRYSRRCGQRILTR